MSFGYSVGDFVAGASLTYQLVRTLSASRGACIEYQEALTELRAMEQVFLQAGNVVRSNIFTQDVNNAIACIALSSIDTIEKFLERTKDLQSRLSHRKPGLDNSWSKVGWQLYGKEELRALKTRLHERLSSINTLITTASNCIKIPPTVAQYQDKSIGIPTNHYTNRESTQSPFPPEISQCDSPPLPSPTIAPPRASEHMLILTPNSGQVAEINTLRVNEPLTSHESVGHSEEKSALTSLHRNLSSQKVSPTRLAINPRYATTGEREFDQAVPRIEKSQAELEQEIRAKIEIENAEAVAAAEAAVADAQFKDNIEMMKEMMTSLYEKEARREAEAEKAKEVKAPIRFKDAVGRKFSFPFHVCQTWQGMEDLIKQAFLHVDIIGPHVQAGHYDLVGPNGEILLPQVWDKIIEPNWQVIMHMWPMDRPGQQPQRHQPPPRNSTQQRPQHHQPPPQPMGPNSTQQWPQHYQPPPQPRRPTEEYLINDPRSSELPARGQRGVLSWMIGAKAGRPGKRQAKSVGGYEPEMPINPSQFQDHPRSGFQDAREGPKKASEFGLLDRFDPNWREVYKSMISSRGLTNEYIRTHQAQIVMFLQNERNLVKVQIPEGHSTCPSECSSRRPSLSQESDAHENRPRFRERRLSKSSTKSKFKRRTAFKKKHLQRGWKTDSEEEE